MNCDPGSEKATKLKLENHHFFSKVLQKLSENMKFFRNELIFSSILAVEKFLIYLLGK